MKNLSLKRIASIVVVAAMLLAILAVSAVAAPTVITLNRANTLGTSSESIVWAKTEATTVETIYSAAGGNTFQWWTKVYLSIDGTTCTVLAKETPGEGATTYETWTIDATHIVITAHADCADASKLDGLAVGDTLTLSDASAIYGFEALSGVTLTTVENEGTSEPAGTTEGITVYAHNAFNNDHAEGVFLWTSETATNVDYIQNSAWDGATPIFSYWREVLLTLTDGEYVVTNISENGDSSYAAWTVDANNIVLAAWNDCTADSAAALRELVLGDVLTPNGAFAAGVVFAVEAAVEESSEAPATSEEESVATSEEESVATSEEESVATSEEESVATSEEESVATSEEESVATSEDESVAEGFDIDAAMGAENEDAKFDITVTGPETYVPGEGITVKVTIDNITVEDGLSLVEFILHYDNANLTLTNSLNKYKEYVVECGKVPFYEIDPGFWESLCRVNHDGSGNIDNDGLVYLSYLTTLMSTDLFAKEDGTIYFDLTFNVAADATEDLYIYVPNVESGDLANAYGSTNTDDGMLNWTCNGSYICIKAPEVVEDSSAEESVETSTETSTETSSEESSTAPVEPAEDIVINIAAFNRYNGNSYEIIGWNADDDDEWKHLEERYAGNYDPAAKTFQWFDKMYLIYDAETEKFVVTAVEGPADGANQYNSWELGYGKLILIAHYEESFDTLALFDAESYNNFVNAQIGDSFYFVGDYDAALSYAGVTPGYALHSEKPDEYWTPAGDETSGDESVEESVEPGTSEEESVVEPGTSEDDTTPEAGDASAMIIFAILAIVAIAGSAVVIRKRG